MPDIRNYLLGFRRAVQSYKSWFLNKSSSGSKDQNNTLRMQLLEWAKPDFTIQRHYKERPHSLQEFFIHFWLVALGFLFCNQTVLNQELTGIHRYQCLGDRLAQCLSLLQRHSLTSGPGSCRTNADEKKEYGQGSTPSYQSKSLISWWFWEISAHTW